MALIAILRPVNADGVRLPDHVDEAHLIKAAGVFEDENERTTWIEYRLDGDDTIVHRSAHVQLKRWPPGAAEALAQAFGS